MRKTVDNFAVGYITAAIVAISFLFISDICDNKPQAMDVYRNKTTLQITYEDSVPVDTVVVFKPEFRK